MWTSLICPMRWALGEGLITYEQGRHQGNILPILALFVHLRIEIAVVEDDGVRPSKAIKMVHKNRPNSNIQALT